ncbi:unnamed protein product [Arabidopsis lyrata]|uniref:Predicted protein n=1 Tax=Arabidopsis lyrata subsp. lyrata TaxID=81972 RepID=D7KMT9_ARALL|nr:predicted protein [Arabidopsis lyrata subsp. lyrata]CAH8254583.1 unnamed protein product [Arabidopsis lyrata]
MARRRRTLSSLCCFAPLPKNPNEFRLLFIKLLKFLAHPLPLIPSSIPSLCLVECRYGSISSLKIFGPPVRCAPPPTKRTSSYFAVGSFLLSYPSCVNRLSRVKPIVSPTSLSGDLCPLLVSVVDDPVASVSRRRLFSTLLGLSQIPTSQFQKKALIWAWPILGPFGFCKGPLKCLGCKQILANLGPNVVQRSSSAPNTSSGYLRLSLCHPLAFSCFFTHRFTGYFSGFPLLIPDTSSVGLICFRSRTTFVGSDPAHLRQSLLTGYFSGVPMPASKANPGCFQPRSTFDGSNFVSTSHCTVTISLPVEVSVLFAISLMGMLVLVSFDTSPGPLSSFFQLVSLCLSYVWSRFLFFKLATRVCPMKPNRHVSF